MSQNKKWLMVLVPQVMMIAMILGIFFLCRGLGMEKKETDFNIYVTFAVTIFVTFIITGTFAVTAFPAVNIAVAIAAFATLAAFIPAIVTFALLIVALVSFSDLVSEKYELSVFCVAGSYLVEVLALFLPIFFAHN